MQRNKPAKRRGISPIIATLLLILIAIASGVVVYAYVIGFVGNSTGNTGATTDTLSIDQLVLSSKPTNFPVTVFVRNQGPSTEYFNTGFYVKSSSIDNQLGPAVSLTQTGATSFTVTSVNLTSTGGASIIVTIAATCSGSGTLSASGFGVGPVTVGTCASSAFTSSPGTLNSLSFTSSSTFNAISGTLSTNNVVTTSALIVGTAVNTGTMAVAINSVGQLTLAPQGTSSSSILSSGSTYSVQVTGNDGGTTTASAKSS